MAKGIFVRETTDIVGVGGVHATRHWIVATDDPALAEPAVRKLSPKREPSRRRTLPFRRRRWKGWGWPQGKRGTYDDQSVKRPPEPA